MQEIAFHFGNMLRDVALILQGTSILKDIAGLLARLWKSLPGTDEFKREMKAFYTWFFFFFNVAILSIDIFENLDLIYFSDLYSYCLLKCFIFISPWNDSVEGNSGMTNIAFDLKGPNLRGLLYFLFLFFLFLKIF